MVEKNTVVAIGLVLVIVLALAIVVPIFVNHPINNKNSRQPEEIIATIPTKTTEAFSTSPWEIPPIISDTTNSIIATNGASSLNITTTTPTTTTLIPKQETYHEKFLGKWKEDQSKRQNLNDFLYYRGVSWIKRTAAGNSDNWWLTMNIVKNGNTYSVNGKKGYYMEEYKFKLTADNTTRSNIDLGTLGGPRIATAEFINDGNTLMTYLHNPDTNEVDVLAIRTIDPMSPNVMHYHLKDVESGTVLIQWMDKQS